jgi:hypothetical protein
MYLSLDLKLLMQTLKLIDMKLTTKEIFIAGMKAAHKIDSEKFGRNFGSARIVKEEAYKKYKEQN